MFNLLSLYTVLAGLEFVIALILLYYLITVKPKGQVLFYFLGYKLLDAIALSGFALFYTQYNFIPFFVSMYILFISWFFQVIAMVSYQGEMDKRFFKFSIITILIFSILYLFQLTPDRWTVIVSDTLAVVLFGAVGWHLFANRKDFKVPYFLATGYTFFAILNVIRVLSVVLAPHKYSFYDNNIVDTIYFLLTSALIVAQTVGFFLLLSEVDKKNIYEQYRLNQVAMEQSPLSIVIAAPDGTINYVNPALCQITGYEPDELIGKKPNIFKSGQTPGEIYASLWKTITSGNTWFGEFVNKKKNGELYYEEVAISPLKNKQGKIDCFFSLKADITHRKKAEALILKQNQELKELDTTKNKLFSIIAHDLRNPVGSTMSILNLANEMIATGETTKAFEMVAMAEGASKSSYNLLENLLNWSRSQLNAVKVNSVTFSINDIVAEIAELYKSSAEQKQIIFSMQIQPNSIVFADVEMVKTVIRNLVSNALKFTPKNGTITIKTEAKESNLIFSIGDSGVGIDKERINKLFNFVENKSTYGTDGEKGTGLGLVLSHEFIVKNNGKLWVESEVGKGSTFYFSLPVGDLKSK